MHKTQCVAITPEGDIAALSSMKEIVAWDLREHDDAAMRPPLQFYNGLTSWHVPKHLVLEREECTGALILGASSSRVTSGGWGGDKKGKERENKIESDNPEVDENSMGLSLSGEHLFAAAKGLNKLGALVAFVAETSTGESAGKITLPDGCTPVTGIPILSRGLKAVFILWDEAKKETVIFRRNIDTGRTSGMRVLRFAYAGGAWQRYAVSPDGRFVAVCISSREMEVVDSRSGEHVALLRLKDSLPSDMGMRKGGLELTKGNCRGKLMAWSIAKRRLVVTTKKSAEVWDIRGG
ncbi:hypothetical protein B0T14DRAFT_495264 [Immersiella caudata]|uniref:Uncharacterized protein n=1 Tax=Immersiella caudata TaxID=314043 RepID=A0AA39WYU7_9PEZI|nr:hypothetical protein B0T14DRAFT_495264 [Immersiella caudata]